MSNYSFKGNLNAILYSNFGEGPRPQSEVHKDFSEFGRTWLTWTDLMCSPIEHRSYLPTSVANRANAVLVEWEQIPAGRFQNRVKSLKPEEGRHLQQHINAHSFGNRFSANTYECNVQVSKYFWPCNI